MAAVSKQQKRQCLHVLSSIRRPKRPTQKHTKRNKYTEEERNRHKGGKLKSFYKRN